MTAGRENLVIVFDLRHEQDDVLDTDRLERRLRDTGREAGVPLADVSRLLVVDNASELPYRQQEYMNLCSAAGLTPQVICLALGSPAAGGGEGPDGTFTETHVLHMPEQLSPSSASAATLWVGDVRGIGWRPGQHEPVTLTSSDMEPDDLRGLQPLIELLQVPEVFDQTFQLLRDMPEATANPALRLMVHEVPEEDLLRAQLQALDACTDASAIQVQAPGGGSAGGTSTGALALLADLAEPQDLSVAAALAGSNLQSAYEQAEDALHDARQDMDRLATWRGLLPRSPSVGESARSLRAAGTTLARYRRRIEQTFASVDGRIGLNEDAREALAQTGIKLPSVPGTGKAEVAGELRAHVLTQLDRRRPLPEIVAGLRDFANRSVPAGSAAQVGKLKRICPDALTGALLDPPLPAVGAGAPAAAVWVALAALFAAAGPAGPWGAAAVLALVPAVVFQVVVAASDGWGELAAEGGLAAFWDAVPRAATGLLAGAWAVGAAVGLGLWLAGAVPVLMGAALLVAAPVALAAAARGLWRTAITGWRAETEVDAATVAARELGDALDLGVLKYWLLADAKADASDQAKALAELVQESCDAFTEFAEQLGRRTRGSWRGEPPLGSLGRSGPLGGRGGAMYAVEYLGQAGPALQSTLAGDFCDLVAEALEPYWNLAMDDPSGASALPIGVSTAELIHEVQQQLARVGTTPPPRFARRPAERPDPATLVGVDLRRVLDVLLPSGGADTLQLCSPGQLRMLNRAPEASRSFGFLPQALKGPLNRVTPGGRPSVPASGQGGGAGPRPSAADPLARTDLVWTGTGRYAGFLRLVPLSSGAVRQARPADQSDEAAPN